MPTVLIYWSPGRTDAQKQRVSRRIHDALVEEGGARAEDVLVIFQNIEPGDAYRPGTTGALKPPTFTVADHTSTEDRHGS